MLVRRYGTFVRRACLYISVGGFVLLPLVYSPGTIDPDIATRMFLLGLLLAGAGAWFIKIRPSKDTTPRLTRGGLFTLGTLLLYLILALTDLRGGPALADGLTDLTRITLWIGMIFMSLFFFGDRTCFASAARAATAGVLILSIIAVFQFFGWGFGFIPGRGMPTATMANKNLLASALLIMLPWVFFVHLTDTPIWRGLSLAATVSATFTIVVIEARASWLALLVSALTVALLWRLVGRGVKTRAASTAVFRHRLLSIAATMIIVAAVSIPVANQVSAGDTVAGRIQASVNFEAGSVAERLALWKASLEMIEEHPWRGVGLGQWRIEQPRFGAKALRTAGADVFYQRPHNDYLWVGAELGVLGIFVYLGIFIAAVILSINRMRSAVTAEERISAMLIAAGLVAYMVVASFSYPRERIVHLFLSGVMIGVALCPVPTANPAKVRLTRRYAGAIMLVCAIFGIVVGLVRYRSEVHASRCWQAFARHDFDLAEREAKLAESFLYHVDPVSTPLQWYIGVAQLEHGDVDSARVSLKRAVEYTPYHPHVLANLAACYEYQNQHKKAAVLYEKAIALSPRFHEALVNLGAVYFNDGQYRKALEALNRAASINKTDQVEQYLDRVRKALGMPTSDPKG